MTGMASNTRRPRSLGGRKGRKGNFECELVNESSQALYPVEREPMKMKQPIVFVTVALLVSVCPGGASAQEAFPELEELQSIFEAEMTERVTNPFNDGFAKLNLSYLTGLERELTSAKSAPDLDAALALDAEIKRLASQEIVPDEDDEAAASLKRLRAIYRTELSKLERKRLAAEATLRAPYLTKLKDLEDRLTKAGNLEDAKAVQSYRKGLNADTPESLTDPAMVSTRDSEARPNSGVENPLIGKNTPELPGDGFHHPGAWDVMRQNPALLEVEGQNSQALREGLNWGKYTWTAVPQKLLDNGAKIYLQDGFPNGLSQFTVIREGWLIVGVNYSYQGNSGGGWQEERWNLKKFESEGWKVISDGDAGGSLIKDNDVRTEERSQTLLARFVEKGESLRLRCNKYDPPFLILLGRKTGAP